MKNKCGDLTDNCRAFALSTALSKIFESVLMQYIITHDDIDKCQFEFKKRYSTTICANVLKNLIEYYTIRGSHLFPVSLTSRKLLTV